MAISFAVSTDYPLIRRLLTDMRCYRRIINDSAPPVDAFQVGPFPDVVYVVASTGWGPLAVFLMIGKIPHEAEIHFSMTPAAWGQSERVAKAFLEWVWRETSVNTLIAEVPSYNSLALRLAKLVGFQDAGMRKFYAGKKHGKYFDLIVLTLERQQMQAVA